MFCRVHHAQIAFYTCILLVTNTDIPDQFSQACHFGFDDICELIGSATARLSARIE